jgi:hypothetical protein
MPGSPQRSLSLRFPHLNPLHTSPFPHTCYMPHPSHSRFCHPPFYIATYIMWHCAAINIWNWFLFLRCEIFLAVTVSVAVIWNMAPCGLYWHFGGICCLHQQCWFISDSGAIGFLETSVQLLL